MQGSSETERAEFFGGPQINEYAPVEGVPSIGVSESLRLTRSPPNLIDLTHHGRYGGSSQEKNHRRPDDDKGCRVGDKRNQRPRGVVRERKYLGGSIAAVDGELQAIQPARILEAAETGKFGHTKEKALLHGDLEPSPRCDEHVTTRIEAHGHKCLRHRENDTQEGKSPRVRVPATDLVEQRPEDPSLGRSRCSSHQRQPD
jgi:hypothetical protein